MEGNLDEINSATGACLGAGVPYETLRDDHLNLNYIRKGNQSGRGTSFI